MGDDWVAVSAVAMASLSTGPGSAGSLGCAAEGAALTDPALGADSLRVVTAVTGSAGFPAIRPVAGAPLLPVAGAPLGATGRTVAAGVRVGEVCLPGAGEPDSGVRGTAAMWLLDVKLPVSTRRSGTLSWAAQRGQRTVRPTSSSGALSFLPQLQSQEIMGRSRRVILRP